MPDQKSKIVVVREFFQLSAKEAMNEWRGLSEEDKLELAIGSAQNLGLTQGDVNFPMS